MTNNRMNLSRKKKFLLRTCTQFDGSSSDSCAAVSYNDEALHSQVVSVSLQRATPSSLVIQALIQQVCTYMEQDGKKRKMLYSAICRVLNEHKFLDLEISLDELWPLKQRFCSLLSSFFSQVHKEISQDFGPCTSLSLRNVFDCVRTDYAHYPSRYQQSFEELDTIAKGGFGVVCKARNKIDGITYAIKKIKFMYTNDVEFQKVLREVRSFALLKHQNIVNYNNSWLETNIVKESTVYKASSDSESYSSDIEQPMSNNSLKYENDTYGISLASNFSETSVNDGVDSNGQNSKLTAMLIDSLNSQASVETHALVVNSEVQIFHRNIVIAENYQSNPVKMLEENIEQPSEICTPQNELNCSLRGGSSHHPQVIHNVECEAENSDSKYHLIHHQIDESGDHSQKPPSRRRRHSSGATCSTIDEIAEFENDRKDISHTRSHDRVSSLDFKRCTKFIHKKADMKWDISNLNVMAVLYIQMELCDRSLRDWLDERIDTPCCSKSDLVFGNALKIFEQIVQGVEHIHSKSVIHRDLKPKNIFLCNDGFIKIGDFGLAALCTQTDDTEFFHSRCSCSHTQGIGTVPYSAPEQREGSNYDNKVDIFSLGIILIELLHHCRTRMEFCSTIDRIRGGSIPVEFVNIWPKEIVNLIENLVSGDPQQRPEAKEVLIRLNRSQVAEPLALSNSHPDTKTKENEALEISQLKAEICALKRQLSEKDETIKELQLKLISVHNCDNFV